jgi:hypothetical protein
MRITAAGQLLIGTTSYADTSYPLVVRAAGYGIFSGLAGNGNFVFAVYPGGNPASVGWNNAQAIVYAAKDNTTSRSINTSGSINASGADYAEYMIKESDFTAQKGDIVGITSSGKLTNQFDLSIGFMVKSTAPCMVGGDIWGTEDIVGKKPADLKETASEEEKAQYDKELAEWTTRFEAERAKVDRIAFSGQVPVNLYGATPGDYIIPVRKEDGTIGGLAISRLNLTFEQYQNAVGKVIKINEDGRAHIVVKSV